MTQKPHPAHAYITEGELRLIMFAVEYGFRQCEKGNNLGATLASVHAMYRVNDGNRVVPGTTS